jgi:hypothetical protein
MPIKQIGPWMFMVTPARRKPRPRLSMPMVGPSECGAGAVPVLTKEMLDAYKASKGKARRPR